MPTRTYTGPELPDAQVAKISVDQKTPPPAYSGRTSDTATIRMLDGQEIKDGGRAVHPKDILVLPGKHEVVAQAGLGSANAMGRFGAAGSAVGTAMNEKAVRKWNAPLSFTAEAGKAYMIRYEFVKGPNSPSKEEYFNRNKGKLWVYWIEEAQTGKHVCGWSPAEFNK
jgi:hypothetical protein